MPRIRWPWYIVIRRHGCVCSNTHTCTLERSLQLNYWSFYGRPNTYYKSPSATGGRGAQLGRWNYFRNSLSRRVVESFTFAIWIFCFASVRFPSVDFFVFCQTGVGVGKISIRFFVLARDKVKRLIKWDRNEGSLLWDCVKLGIWFIKISNEVQYIKFIKKNHLV